MAYTTYTNTNSRLSASPHGETLPARLLAAVQRWHQRARDRAELARLTARDARDLGIDPGVIAYEASKPFWRA
ncbi:MAG TPA: DUF1127 domain-containing protein [Vineibacter sp.]|nr:DUF1127 domain-containing protein [Vineibacter sp.]